MFSFCYERTDVPTDTVRENNDHLFCRGAWWVNKMWNSKKNVMTAIQAIRLNATLTLFPRFQFHADELDKEIFSSRKKQNLDNPPPPPKKIPQNKYRKGQKKRLDMLLLLIS